MASVYDIVRGINQAAANAYDGSHDERFVEDGADKAVGLKREKGCPINDSRVMDGFNIRMSGPTLIISYQSEMPVSAFHNTKLDQELEETYAGIAKFLKKEYKKVTGDTLSLNEDGKVDVILKNISKIRTWVQAIKSSTFGIINAFIEVAGL